MSINNNEFVQNESIPVDLPGLETSSKHIYYNPRSSESDGDSVSVFDCGALLFPFHEIPDENINDNNDNYIYGSCYRSPIICLKCASFLCPYSHIIPESGDWICSICKFVNPCFHSNINGNDYESNLAYTKELFPGLRYPHIDYIHNSTSNIDIKSIRSETLYIYAFDNDTCGDKNAISLFYDSLNKLSTSNEGLNINYFIFDINYSIYLYHF
jgi:hypothetical protein